MARKRLLITGGRGFVAGSVMARALPEWDVHALSRASAPAMAGGVHWQRMRSIDESALRSCLDKIGPDAIIHAAAIADIDYCESNSGEAHTANTQFTGHLADYCKANGVRLVYVSTDNVFDGKIGGYCETDSANPVNVYGRTKVAAEQRVLSGGDAVVARLALVIGLPVFGQGNTFLSRMLARLETEERIGVPGEEIRTPIDVLTAGEALLELAGNRLNGVIHLGGAETVNRLDLARCAVQRFRFSSDRLVANDPATLPGRAERPRDVSFNVDRARTVLETPMIGVEDGLDRIVHETAGLSEAVLPSGRPRA